MITRKCTLCISQRVPLASINDICSVPFEYYNSGEMHSVVVYLKFTQITVLDIDETLIVVLKLGHRTDYILFWPAVKNNLN